MLTRIISAAVGLVIVLTVLFFHSTPVLPVAVAVIIGIMLYELLRAVKMHKCVTVLGAVEVCGICTPLFSAFGIEKFQFAVSLAASFAVFLTWLMKHKMYRYDQIMFSLACMFLVPQSMTCLVRLDRYSSSHGLLLLVLGLCGAWIADSGAYFAGVALGKHKLCPEISPKKTVEGLVGGLITTAVVFFGIFFVYENYITENPINMNAAGYLFIAFVGMICAGIGTIGDLSASMIKRQIGFKDYGKIMPGHGGMMDRFDSVIFVVPTFYTFISLTGIIK